MGFFRRIRERIREFFIREPARVETPDDEDDEDGAPGSDLDSEFQQQGWAGVDLTDAYYVVEAAIEDMEDRGSL